MRLSPFAEHSLLCDSLNKRTARPQPITADAKQRIQKFHSPAWVCVCMKLQYTGRLVDGFGAVVSR